jgi:hypothetical protein
MNVQKDNAFLAKAGLITLLAGFGLIVLAMIFQQHEAGMATFFLTLLASLACALYSRKHPISRATLMIDIILIVIAGSGVVAKILFSYLITST